MSILNDPRVTEIDGGYRAPARRSALQGESECPRGMLGSGSSQIEETIEWALRTDATTELSR